MPIKMSLTTVIFLTSLAASAGDETCRQCPAENSWCAPRPDCPTFVHNPKFFSNGEFQSSNPGAFAVQAVTSPVIEQLDQLTVAQGDEFISALGSHKDLESNMSNFDKLDLDAQTKILKAVFDVQVVSMGIQAPAFTLDPNYARGTYFEFDPEHPDAGKVYINPRSLTTPKEPFGALMFLIHETRHSYQFQLANTKSFANGNEIAGAWKLAFEKQKNPQGTFSWLDFMTLNNEYEAFRFSNYVMGKLTHFSASTLGMGSYASQFDRSGQPLIDLPQLLRQSGPAAFLNSFDRIEEDQYLKLKQQ